MSFGKITPILRIFDEAKAREFDVDYFHRRPHGFSPRTHPLRAILDTGLANGRVRAVRHGPGIRP